MRSEFALVGSMGSSIPILLSLFSLVSLFVPQSRQRRPDKQEPNSVGSRQRLHLHTKFYLENIDYDIDQRTANHT